MARRSSIALLAQFASDALAFRTTQAVRIAANRTTTVSVPAPEMPLHINAAPWADVWIDGESVGQTPLGDLLADPPVGLDEAT